MATAEGKPRRAGALLKRLKGKRVCICVGSGGVGKTTTSAALALGLAARGQKVAVVTIDPAARLASALGLERLSGEPRLIEPALLAEHGIECKGEREQILANPIYRELSSAVAGSQELSAMVKLYELRHERDFDVIVLDTPPSRNAVDFLETPTRLLGFLEGRALKVFMAPSGLAARLFGRSTGVVFSIFARVTGVDMLNDLSTFFRSLSGVLDGFGERTRGVDALLRSPSTAFLIVTSPEIEPSREAAFLASRLRDAGMSEAHLIVNRVHRDGLDGHSVEDVASALAPKLGEELAARAAGNLADFDVLARRDSETI